MKCVTCHFDDISRRFMRSVKLFPISAPSWTITRESMTISRLFSDQCSFSPAIFHCPCPQERERREREKRRDYLHARGNFYFPIPTSFAYSASVPPRLIADTPSITLHKTIFRELHLAGTFLRLLRTINNYQFPGRKEDKKRMGFFDQKYVHVNAGNL